MSSVKNQAGSIPPRAYVVVSWSGAVALHLSPRGQRTHHLINALETYGQVERVGGAKIPKWLTVKSERTTSSWHRRLARRMLNSVLIDKYEIAVRRELRGWRPQADAAVLVGYPWSPLSIASRKLAAAGIPYIVDVGDPWILTEPEPERGWLRKLRARRQERRLWSRAAGAIVTTQRQGDDLKRLFPHLPILVRPNGYRPLETPAGRETLPAAPPSGKALRLVHYGSLYGERVDFRQIFQRLVASKRWDTIELVHYGADWGDLLDSLSGIIAVEHRSPLTWSEVVSEAHAFDAAVVIGWNNTARMPSKAIQYLTLPIPRIAMANSDPVDALREFATDRAGWAVIDAENDGIAQTLSSHLSRTWTAAELEAPESESWESVERVLGTFIARTII